MLRQIETVVLNPRGTAPPGEGLPHLREFLFINGEETYRIEETQQPGLFKLPGFLKTVPNLERSSNELIAAGPLHTVDTEIGAAYTHRILRRPGSRRVVLRGYQPPPGIHGHGNRRPLVHITETEHQISRRKHNIPYLVPGLQTVDSPDKLDIVGTPWRLRIHRAHVDFNGPSGGGIIPAEGQIDTAFRPHRIIPGRVGVQIVPNPLNQG